MPIIVFAHEMWYERVDGQLYTYPQRWIHEYSGFADLRTNNDNLTGPAANNYIAAISGWSSSSCPVWAEDTDFSISSVDYCTPSRTYWSSTLGLGTTVMGCTDNVDTEGLHIEYVDDAKNSNGLITYSAI